MARRKYATKERFFSCSSYFVQQLRKCPPSRASFALSAEPCPGRRRSQCRAHVTSVTSLQLSSHITVTPISFRKAETRLSPPRELQQSTPKGPPAPLQRYARASVGIEMDGQGCAPTRKHWLARAATCTGRGGSTRSRLGSFMRRMYARSLGGGHVDVHPYFCRGWRDAQRMTWCDSSVESQNLPSTLSSMLYVPAAGALGPLACRMPSTLRMSHLLGWACSWAHGRFLVERTGDGYGSGSIT